MMLSELDNTFIDYVIEYLDIQTSPNIVIGDDHAKAKEIKALGCYYPSENVIWVLRGSRVIADWYRTLAHELVHWRQRELNQVMDGSDGSDLENEANSKAAIILRNFGRSFDEIYSMSNSDPVDSISN